MKTNRTNRSLPLAHSIKVRSCSCGSIHIDFCDENDNEFATATMEPEHVDLICAGLQKLKLKLLQTEMESVSVH